MWQCPWCYKCPMVPPSSHRSLKTSSALQKMAISAEILTKIEETVKLAITNCQAPNLKSIESQLSKLSEAVETYSKKEPLITQPPSSNNIRIATEELIESSPHVSSVTPTCTPYAIYKEISLQKSMQAKFKISWAPKTFMQKVRDRLFLMGNYTSIWVLRTFNQNQFQIS